MSTESLSEFAKSLARATGTVSRGRSPSPIATQLQTFNQSLRSYVEKTGGQPRKDSAASWIVDNYPLLHTLIRETRTSLPKQFYTCLPSAKGKPARVDIAARGLVDFAAAVVKAEALDEFVTAYQTIRSFSTAELWAIKHLLHFHLVRVVAEEAAKQSPVTDLIAASITSLRKLEAFDWRTFVEDSLAVEKILNEDPSGHYRDSDFSTRDLYRHAIESMARHSTDKNEDMADAELRVARAAVELAATRDIIRQRHIGFWLVDRGQKQFKREIGYRQKPFGTFRDFIRQYPSFHYVGFTLLFTALIIAAAARLLAPLPLWTFPWWTVLFMVLPALHVALAILNPLVTFALPPKLLPRLDYLKGVPSEFKSVVVVPTLLLSPKNVKDLLENLEIHYLANRDKNILFALLTDFADANTVETHSDTLLNVCAQGIETLNDRYASSGQRPFYLFHRPRQWNSCEGKWMGWERKRGKINDFNEWLLGKSDYFSRKVGDLDRLRGAKYVITLDSDTQLPRDTALKMIGMLAHPLNVAVLDPDRNVVTEGYGLLLPRVGVSLASSTRSRLARLYSGKVGYDPYATAVSDVYMDLFGQASFTGKGIYDVAVFEKVTARFPENTLLSHDLIEGEHVRVGLCADQEVIDDFPQRYEAFCKRKHRWVRGDWQILKWLLRRVPDRFNGSAPNPLPLISRWKIFDNLRRSLMEISFFVWFAAAWTFLPGDGLRWTLIALAMFVLPVWFDLIVAAIRIPPPRFIRPYVREVSFRFVQGHLDALVTLIFLPHQALLMADAILRTLARQFVTHKNLLEWESMAAVEAGSSGGTSLPVIYLWASAVLSLLLIVIVPGGEPWSLLAFGVLEIWLISPLVGLWLDSAPAAPQGITDGDRQFLRDIALNTWRYYLDYANQEHNWLIPDNVQETPPAVANRTSPTNIGLQLNAYLTALDLGYSTAEEFVQQTAQTLETMGRLQRYQGHWFNWYDTKSLAVLPPQYVSAVDSGNLAASLLIAKQGCLEAVGRRIVEPADRAGLTDAFLRLQNVLPRESRTHSVNRIIDSAVAQLRSEPSGLFFWEGLLSETKSALGRLEQALAAETQQDAVYWIGYLRQRLQAQTEHLCRFAPWMCEALEKEFRFSFNDPAMEHLLGLLSAIPTYSQLQDHYESIRKSIADRLDSRRSMHELTKQALHYLDDALPGAKRRAEQLTGALKSSAAQSSDWLNEMDFRFLFDSKRSLLRIGAEVAADADTPDESYYDLLASEARTAVLLGIAKGEMPREAWFQLGRKLTHYRGQHCLVSWSGTMFEYLMPNLFMRTYPGTLLHETTNAVVKIQKAYASERRVPWGISESACNTRDDLMNYQYHAFGVPWLRARRDSSGRIVVAPYATMLSLLSDPVSAVEHARLLVSKGWLGRHGFFEAIDFTAAKGFHRADQPAVVRAFMAHHQGMTLLAIDAAVLGSPMQKRFHADPLVQAAEYLLQERAPEIIQEPEEMPAVIAAASSEEAHGNLREETKSEATRGPEVFESARP